MKYLVFCAFALGLLSCKKNDAPDQHLIAWGATLQCKVDGVNWYASKDGDLFARSVSATLNGDSSLLLSANSGTESVGISIYSGSITQGGPFSLSGNLPYTSSAFYDNDLSVANFTTDSLRGGIMRCTFDKDESIVYGGFSFDAYHPVTQKVVHITDGFFSIEYRAQ